MRHLPWKTAALLSLCMAFSGCRGSYMADWWFSIPEYELSTDLEDLSPNGQGGWVSMPEYVDQVWVRDDLVLLRHNDTIEVLGSGDLPPYPTPGISFFENCERTTNFIQYIANYIELHRKYELAVRVCSAFWYEPPSSRTQRLKLRACRYLDIQISF